MVLAVLIFSEGFGLDYLNVRVVNPIMSPFFDRDGILCSGYVKWWDQKIRQSTIQYAGLVG